MKKIIIIISSILLIFSLSGCTKTDRSDLFDYTKMDVNKLDNIDSVELNKLLKNDGVLTVGTSPDYAPYSFLDLELKGQEQIQGSESAIAFYVAKSLGLEVYFENIAFDGLTTSLNSGDIDIIFSGLTYSSDRAKNYTFTDTYYATGDGGQVLLALSENASKFSDFDSINMSSVTIGAQNGSLQYDLVEEFLPNSTVTPFGKIEEGVISLNSNKFDLMACSKTSAEELIKSNSNIVILESYSFPAQDYGTMGLLKKDSPLAPYINQAIETLDNEAYAGWLSEYQAYSDYLSIDFSDAMIVRVFQIMGKYGFYFLEGAGITILLSVLTVIFGTILGIGLLYLKKNNIKILKVIGTAYIEVVRGVPLLLQLWVIYIISPSSWPAFLSVVVALVLNSGAYVSEIIRAGIEGIDKGQYEACRSLGLSKFQTMKKVILPQAIKKISPALGNEFVMLIKETSLASVFFVGDLMTIKNNITSITYLSLEPFFVIAIVYFVLTFSTTKVIKYFEMKMEA